VRNFLPITKALSDETRLRLLMALRSGELCLCQLIDLLQLAPSTVSKHMALLQQAGLVERRKDGRWHFYRLPEQPQSPATEQAVAWVTQSLAGEPVIRGDEERLAEIRRKDLEELSACYRT
jgi:DNA-binding transcriptional ArsR family regulator